MKLHLESLAFKYPGGERGAPKAVNGIDLQVEDGEFFSLLGPSGCGKTTLLWLVAGFHPPTAGHIFFGEDDVTHLPPEKRKLGMVFQNYALFPHLNVADNIAFGLRARGEDHNVAQARVKEMLQLVDLPGLGKRMPSELSGGQQQRVALARALAVSPELLLLDEPLSNLDAALRIVTRGRIKALQKKLNLTTLYVTHDQEEAMAISDRIAILNRGKVLQVGTPQELYEQPDEPFVAKFLGRCNLIKAKATGKEGIVSIGGRQAGPIAGSSLLPKKMPAGWQLLVMLRPEEGSVASAHTADPNDLHGASSIGDIEFGAQFNRIEYLGGRRVLFFDAPNFSVAPIELEVASTETVPFFAAGQPLRLKFDATRARLLPPGDEDEAAEEASTSREGPRAEDGEAAEDGDA